MAKIAAFTATVQAHGVMLNWQQMIVEDRAADLSPSQPLIAGKSMAETKAETDARQASRRVAHQLDRDADALGCHWWETETAGVIADLARSGPFNTVFAALAQAIHETEDPLWVVGHTTVDAAHRVAWEWLKTGIDPATVLDWLRAGCWDAGAALRLANVGIDPKQLLDDEGRPIDRVAISNKELVPLAQAVADKEITPETAARSATNR